ncbi:unnamed protein product, partial [Prorocentrum cordatum]
MAWCSGLPDGAADIAAYVATAARRLSRRADSLEFVPLVKDVHVLFRVFRVQLEILGREQRPAPDVIGERLRIAASDFVPHARFQDAADEAVRAFRRRRADARAASPMPIAEKPLVRFAETVELVGTSETSKQGDVDIVRVEPVLQENREQVRTVNAQLSSARDQGSKLTLPVELVSVGGALAEPVSKVSSAGNQGSKLTVPIQQVGISGALAESGGKAQVQPVAIGGRTDNPQPDELECTEGADPEIEAELAALKARAEVPTADAQSISGALIDRFGAVSSMVDHGSQQTLALGHVSISGALAEPVSMVSAAGEQGSHLTVPE